jgi:hypothetical protein
MQTLSYLECELPLPPKMAQIHRLSGISRIILAYFSFTRSIALLTLACSPFWGSRFRKNKINVDKKVTIRLTAAIISRCQERMLK